MKAAPGNAAVVDTFAWVQHLLGNNELAASYATLSCAWRPA